MSAPDVAVEYMSIKMLATYASLSERTLRGYLTHPAHPLPCHRIGGKVLVRRSDFDEWAKRFRSVSSSDVDRLVREAIEGL